MTGVLTSDVYGAQWVQHVKSKHYVWGKHRGENISLFPGSPLKITDLTTGFDFFKPMVFNTCLSG